VITAVDTSVLLDVFIADKTHGPASRAAIKECLAEGSLVACDIVWAEISAFSSADKAAAAMEGLGVAYSPLTTAAALAAGEAWKAYRRKGGTRTRMVADFLIGAHAKVQAERLLSRDRGFYRAYFRGLEIVEPR
jgi:hypothetical protein